MTIFCMDLATTTGFAFGSGDERPYSGSVRFDGAIGRYAAELEAWMGRMVEIYHVKTVYIEAPIVAGKTNLNTTMKLMGGQVIAHKVCYEFGVPCTPVNVSSWRKAFIGRSTAPKEIPKNKRRKWLKAAAMKECERRGWNVTSDDEADALGLLSYAITEETSCGRRKC